MVGFINNSYLYVLGYDATEGKDEVILTIGKRDKNGKMNVERVYRGKDAMELYHHLNFVRRAHYGI